MKTLLSIMSNIQAHFDLKLDFQKWDQHQEGRWLIHDTEQRRDNQWEILEFPF